MKTACIAWALVVTLVIANTAAAAGKKKDVSKNGSIPYFQTIDKYLKPATLTDDQTSKLADLKKEYEPKFKDAYAAKQNVLTPDQQKAGEDAKKEAQAAGKKGKELKAAVAAAVKETDEQKDQESKAKAQLTALEKELHGKVKDLLTAEQKE